MQKLYSLSFAHYKTFKKYIKNKNKNKNKNKKNKKQKHTRCSESAFTHSKISKRKKEKKYDCRKISIHLYSETQAKIIISKSKVCLELSNKIKLYTPPIELQPDIEQWFHNCADELAGISYSSYDFTD